MANKTCAALAIALLLALPGAARAQSTQLVLDFRPFAGALSLAWPATPTWLAGFAIGGGIDELVWTLHPSSDSSAFHTLEQIVHISTFARRSPSDRVDIDIGLRAGFGSVRVCNASDCWPGAYTAAYAAVFWGSRRWKVGTRLFLGAIRDPGNPTDRVVHLEILTGRVRF